MKNYYLLIPLIFFSACAVQKSFNPAKKLSPHEMQQDYELFRNILEESHPSLYWYTSKDSIDYFFNTGAAKLKDSLPEYKFRNILSYVVANIRCGHTSVRASKAATRYAERTTSIAFPLSLKIWDDTAIVTSNLNRRDSLVTRGALLKSIEGRPISVITDSLFKYISSDGHNMTHKYQTLSNLGVFRNMYGSIFGLRQKLNVSFTDTLGRIQNAQVNLYVPVRDTTKRPKPTTPQPSRKERKHRMLVSQRNIRIDTSINTAFLEVNSFTKKNKLRSFFRQSFKRIRKEKISNLVVDVRGNGGGSVVLSNLLTKYIADKPFKIADSLYAVKNKSSYKKYISSYFPVRLFFIFMTRKNKDDDYYHFRHFENRFFQPKKKNNFNGNTYILTGGNTFSAATLFTKSIKDQKDVIVLGEETGGGAYGNTAWLIPDVTLPRTKVRFRLPLFRLVIDKNEQKGRGILPEVEVKPTVEAIRRNADYKMEKTIELIKKNRL